MKTKSGHFDPDAAPSHMTDEKKSRPQKGKPFYWVRRRVFAPANGSIDGARVYVEAARRICPEPLPGSWCIDGPEPVVFLYRHAVELYFKAILWDFGSDLKEPIDRDEVYARGHDLCKQLPDLTRVSLHAGRPCPANVASGIRQLSAYDPDSTLFRYAPASEAMLRKKPKRERTIKQFDLAHFVGEMDSIVEYLEALYTDLQDNWALEISSEFRDVSGM